MYVSSSEFRNYKNRQELATSSTKPETDFKLTTIKEDLRNNHYRVILRIEVSAKINENELLFKIAVDYAGEFLISDFVTEDVIEEILLVDCVTLLFPYARHVISELCINGGYLAVMLEPLDFKKAYFNHKHKQAKTALGQAN
jgi:preprotein translocase subunit SecB